MVISRRVVLGGPVLCWGIRRVEELNAVLSLAVPVHVSSQGHPLPIFWQLGDGRWGSDIPWSSLISMSALPGLWSCKPSQPTCSSCYSEHTCLCDHSPTPVLFKEKCGINDSPPTHPKLHAADVDLQELNCLVYYCSAVFAENHGYLVNKALASMWGQRIGTEHAEVNSNEVSYSAYLFDSYDAFLGLLVSDDTKHFWAVALNDAVLHRCILTHISITSFYSSNWRIKRCGLWYSELVSAYK